MIFLRGIKKSFGDRKILKGIDLDIKEKKTTVIFGLSGGGKSTIIKHIIGLLKPDEGSILLDNEDITKYKANDLAKLRRKIGFLFQSGALFDSMNVRENLAFPLIEHTKKTKVQIEKEIEEKLLMVGLKPKEVLNLYPDELSGGMRKRVGLVRTIMLNPKVILYDEPTSGLDPITSDLITRMIKNLQENLGITSVLISHDIRESFKVGDYFAMLYDGKIILYDDAKSFKNTDNAIVNQFLNSRADGPISFDSK